MCEVSHCHCTCIHLFNIHVLHMRWLRLRKLRITDIVTTGFKAQCTWLHSPQSQESCRLSSPFQVCHCYFHYWSSDPFSIHEIFKTSNSSLPAHILPPTHPSGSSVVFLEAQWKGFGIWAWFRSAFQPHFPMEPCKLVTCKSVTQLTDL